MYVYDECVVLGAFDMVYTVAMVGMGRWEQMCWMRKCEEEKQRAEKKTEVMPNRYRHETRGERSPLA